MIKNGLGLRTEHFSHILEHKPQVSWFEIVTENFIFSDGNARHVLEGIRANYPIVTHGVSLNIGSCDPLDLDFLKRLKSFKQEFEPLWISDHLCWTGINGKNSHDLLPVPYTQEALELCADKIDKTQSYLGEAIVLENPSSYLEFSSNEYSEHEFLAALVKKTGCKLLLDVNNVYVSAFNHNFNSKEYIASLPSESIQQIHLAGHQNNGDHIIDTHDDFVIDPVWRLYQYSLETHGFVPGIVEWDANLPSFDTLYSEYTKMNAIAKNYWDRNEA